MTTTATLGLLFITTGLLIAGLSIPLICRKIPMNRFYGVRFRQSFKSPENWYEINSYGGKLMLLSTVPVFLVGIAGLFLPASPLVTAYFVAAALAAILPPMILATILSYFRARAIDRKNRDEKEQSANQADGRE